MNWGTHHLVTEIPVHISFIPIYINHVLNVANVGTNIVYSAFEGTVELGECGSSLRGSVVRWPTTGARQRGG